MFLFHDAWRAVAWRYACKKQMVAINLFAASPTIQRTIFGKGERLAAKTGLLNQFWLLKLVRGTKLVQGDYI